MAGGKYGTPYSESEVLLSVQARDTEHALNLLADFLPGELASLADAARRLVELCRVAAAQARYEQPEPERVAYRMPPGAVASLERMQRRLDRHHERGDHDG